MKVLFLCLVILTITNCNKLKLVKLDIVTGRVVDVYFDSLGNTYVISEKSTETVIYKLDSNNNLEFVIQMNGAVKSHIDDNDNHYISIYHFREGTTKRAFSKGASYHKLGPYEKSVEELFSYFLPDRAQDFRSFVDKNGNIIFNAEEGVGIFSPGYDRAKVIGNLRGYAFHDHAIDGDGNIYLATHLFSSQWKFLSVLTKNELRELRPTVKILSYAEDPDYLTYWHNSIIMTEYKNSRGSIKVLRNESVDELLSEYEVRYGNLMDQSLIPTEDRLYVLGRKQLSGKVSPDQKVMYINKNFEIAKIKQTIPTYITLIGKGHASTKNGKIYFVGSDTKDSHYLLSLKPNETTFKKIEVDTDERVMDMAVDNDDNLWILTKHLFCLMNNKEKAIPVSLKYFKEDLLSFIRVKKSTNEVYVYNAHEFYVWTSTTPKRLIDYRKEFDTNSDTEFEYDEEHELDVKPPAKSEKVMSTTTIIIIVVVVVFVIGLLFFAKARFSGSRSDSDSDSDCECC